MSFLDTWTAEKAWWWGILLGDGNVYSSQEHGTHRVTVVGSYSTTRRWLDLKAPYKDHCEIKREHRTVGTYQAYVDSKQLIEWFDKNAFVGPKAARLPWPEDLPSEHMIPFIRGLWDSDGWLAIFHHDKGHIPEFKAGFGVMTPGFVYRLRDELTRLTRLSPPAIYESSGTHKFSYGSSSAEVVADLIYRDAPEHLRNDDRFDVYLQMRKIRAEYDSIMCPCGVKAERQGFCITCWYKYVYISKVDPSITCFCGKPVHAKGLCSACRSRQVRAEMSGQTLEAALTTVCKTPDCGKYAVTGKDVCKSCLLKVHTGPCSTCHERPGNCAFGLCKVCYERQRRARAAQQQAQEDGVPYVHKPAGRPDLDKFNDEIVAAYKSGVSAAQLAKTYRASGPTIADRLRKAGVHIRKRWEEVVQEPVSDPPAETSEDIECSGSSSFS